MSSGGSSLGVVTNASVAGTQRLELGPNTNSTGVIYIIGSFMYEI